MSNNGSLDVGIHVKDEEMRRTYQHGFAVSWGTKQEKATRRGSESREKLGTHNRLRSSLLPEHH